MMQLLHADGAVTVDEGVSLYYRVEGDGPREVVTPLASWLADDMGPLAASRRVVFYDPRGRGRSNTITDMSRIGLGYELSDLQALRDHFQLRRFSLLGWSLMGVVSACYAIEHPDDIDRLVLVCPTPPRREPYHTLTEEAAQKRLAALDPESAQLLREGNNAQQHASFIEHVSHCRRVWRTFVRTRTGRGHPSASFRSDPCLYPNEWPEKFLPWFLRMRESFGDWDWRAGAASFSGPVLVIHGIDDIIPVTASEEWASSFPNARLWRMPGVGHFPMIEEPARFFAAVNTFLNGDWPEGV